MRDEDRRKGEEERKNELMSRSVTVERRAPQLEASQTKQAPDFGERVKELNCLYGISKLVEKEDVSLEEILEGTVNLIPPSWQYPEITCARITLENGQFRTDNFRETPWKQSSDIVVYDKKTGILEVFYLEKRPKSDEGPFLKEERSLVDAVAERLAGVIDQKQAQEALRESEENLRNILSSSPDAITVTNLEGKILECNKATLDLHGFSTKQELMDRSAFDLIAPKDQKRAAKNMEKILKDGFIRNVEYTFLTKDTNEFPAELSASVIRDSSGKPTCFVAITKDITERKKAEEALKESEEKYRLVVENTNEAILVSQDGKHKFVNSKMVEMTGYSEEELMSAPFLGFIHPDDREMVVERYQKRLAGEKLPHIYPFRIVDKSGSTRWVEINAARFNWGGRPATLSFLTDITERKNAKKKIQEQIELLNV
ncbi:PAS domain S-box protein, partial [Candidatus Aerophobetes bacterium]